ncbi:MAG: hypothetical protein Q8K26_02115 [Candidatus Gracilibacteria bacterium]|nr:hypothetical protein [Candidatus Gracilibacteria bacterium]
MFQNKESMSTLDKKLFFLGWLNAELDKRFKRRTILVGGSAVEVYSGGVFQSSDIDLIYASSSDLDEVLLSNGFEKRGRYWENDEADIQVEAPSSKLEGDDSKIVCITHGKENIYIISIEDLIIDRLKAFVYWQDRTSLEQAQFLIESNTVVNELDREYILAKLRLDTKIIHTLEKEKSITILSLLTGKQ